MKVQEVIASLCNGFCVCRLGKLGLYNQHEYMQFKQWSLTNILLCCDTQQLQHNTPSWNHSLKHAVNVYFKWIIKSHALHGNYCVFSRSPAWQPCPRPNHHVFTMLNLLEYYTCPPCMHMHISCPTSIVHCMRWIQGACVYVYVCKYQRSCDNGASLLSWQINTFSITSCQK